MRSSSSSLSPIAANTSGRSAYIQYSRLPIGSISVALCTGQLRPTLTTDERQGKSDAREILDVDGLFEDAQQLAELACNAGGQSWTTNNSELRRDDPMETDPTL